MTKFRTILVLESARLDGQRLGRDRSWPDRKILEADGQDALVVSVSILDAKGRVVPDANNRVSFQLACGGRILGVGNGNPSDHDPDRANQRRAFNGHCIAIIQAAGQPEVLRLTATSPGLKPATVRLQCK